MVTLLGLCRTRAIVHATPTGMASAPSKITGMIADRTYAIRYGRCTTTGRCAATNAGASGGGGHLGSTLDMRHGSQVAIQVPGYEGTCDATDLPRHAIRYLTRVAPPAFEQRTQQDQGFRSGPRCSGGTAALADGPAQCGGECPMRPSNTAARAIGE